MTKCVLCREPIIPDWSGLHVRCTKNDSTGFAHEVCAIKAWHLHPKDAVITISDDEEVK